MTDATDMGGVWTDYVPLENLVEADVNPQQHDVERLVALLAEHGAGTVAKVDERTGKMLAGHGRRKALWSMFERGMDRPWGVMPAEDGRGWLVPVERGWSSRDDAQAAEMLLALNWSQNWGADSDKAKEWQLLDLINATDPDGLDRLALTAEDMDAMFAEVNPDLSDITGVDDDGSGAADPGPDQGQDEDSPLDRDEGKNICCPACGHVFPSRP